MAGSMNRLHDLLPRIIHELDEELPVGVLGLDNWGYITMGPDRNPDSMPSDGWGLFHPPEYYYYMDPPSTTTTSATTWRMNASCAFDCVDELALGPYAFTFARLCYFRLC